jgi:transposase
MNFVQEKASLTSESTFCYAGLQIEAVAILKLPLHKAIDTIFALAVKAEKYDHLCSQLTPTTPSGMTPTHLNTNAQRRPKRPGRKKRHDGVSLREPQEEDHSKGHTHERCPHCHTPLKKAVKECKRYSQDISPVKKSEVTEQTVHGYWCSQCKKVVFAPAPDALPNSMIRVSLLVFAAWLYYLVGVSVHNIVRTLSVLCRFKIGAGGLTQARKNVSILLEPIYNAIGQNISTNAILTANETGSRLNGIIKWLWRFTTKGLCYYLITKSRASPVVKRILGTLLRPILICSF